MWIPAAASGWLEVALESRSPRPLVISSVAVAVMLLAGTFASSWFIAGFYVFFSGLMPGHEQLYSDVLVAGSPLLLATTVAWSFTLSARPSPSRNYPAIGKWVFLGDLPAAVPRQAPLQLCKAIAAGIVAGLVFCLFFETIYFRSYLPLGIGRWFGSVWDWCRAWTEETLGNEGYLIPILAAVSQACAAIVAAIQARRLEVLQGLFAAFVAALVISIWYWAFFFVIGSGQPYEGWVVATLGLFQFGTLLAFPAAGIAAFASGQLRKARLGRGKSKKIAFPARSDRDRKLECELSTPFRSLLRRGAIAALCCVVLAGSIARISGLVSSARELARLRASAENGDAEAQDRLGLMYLHGKSIARDDSEALAWFLKAASQGYADAENNVAGMYLAGRGVPRNEQAALSWLRLAAEQGHAAAENNLGQMYLYGVAVPQDDRQALIWCSRAAKKGNADAENNLGMMYYLGREVRQDDATAVYWFRKSAEQGYFKGQSNLGMMYFLGRGMPHDEGQAEQWLLKSAEQGYADAQNNLGLLYARRQTARDDARAVQWFGKSAAQGHAGAQNNLGQMYELGRSLPRDQVQAIAWMRKAADQGLAEARHHLDAACATGLKKACPDAESMSR